MTTVWHPSLMHDFIKPHQKYNHVIKSSSNYRMFFFHHPPLPPAKGVIKINQCLALAGVA